MDPRGNGPARDRTRERTGGFFESSWGGVRLTVITPRVLREGRGGVKCGEDGEVCLSSVMEECARLFDRGLFTLDAETVAAETRSGASGSLPGKRN